MDILLLFHFLTCNVNGTRDLYNVGVYQQDRCTTIMEELREILAGVWYAAKTWRRNGTGQLYFNTFK